MAFNSLTFGIFLIVVLVVYYRLPLRGQNAWLVAASMVFYGWWDWRFLGLLAVTSVLDFVASNKIHDSDDESARRRWLLISVAGNLSILGFFKYFNFFADSAQALASAVGLQLDPWTLKVVLPIGVSFYTFQEMAYTIDVYRRVIAPTRDFLTFGLFVSYFPQLVAGPISRASQLLPQLERPRAVTGTQFREGVSLIFLGLFKKVAIADAMAPFVDAHFIQARTLSGSSLLIALYLFAIQIYCDFSGYSDIARGTSKLLGIDLMVNFRQPYFSTSINEFWRRWHISLSYWLRDYVYVPLGSSRRGNTAKYRNLMLTMLIGGLWHGANWTFVVWGGLHGAYLVGNTWIDDRFSLRVRHLGILAGVTKGLITFHLVCLTWIFFRADSLSSAWTYLWRISTWSGGNVVLGEFDVLRCGVLTACLLAVDAVLAWPQSLPAAIVGNPVARGLAYGAAAVVWLALGGVDAQVPFIYFQF